MKDTFRFTGIVVLAMITGSLLTACSAKSPEQLAKETFEIGQQSLGALLDTKKADELRKKAVKINTAVAKMSQSDRQRYTAELARLSGNALGDMYNSMGELFGAVSDMFGDINTGVYGNIDTDDMQKTLDTANKALDTAGKALDLINTGDINPDVYRNIDTDDMRETLDTANKALDTANKALDLINTMGF